MENMTNFNRKDFEDAIKREQHKRLQEIKRIQHKIVLDQNSGKYQIVMKVNNTEIVIGEFRGVKETYSRRAPHKKTTHKRGKFRTKKIKKALGKGGNQQG